MFSIQLVCIIANAQGPTFEEHQRFLENFTKVIVLQNPENRQLLVAPEFQGRIMCLSANGMAGKATGWINYPFIRKNTVDPDINPYGGIDRLWIGPLGSQFTLYYQGKAFDDKYWHVPHDFDRKPFTVTARGADYVEMRCEMHFSNFVHTPFHIRIDRKIRLLTDDQVVQNLGLEIPVGVRAVGCFSENTMTNLGEAWQDAKGTLALWNLAQLQGNDSTVIMIPLKPGDQDINTYLADIPDSRLKIDDKLLLFRGDGKFRSKIGTPPERTIPVFGSLDLKQNILTVIQFSFGHGTKYFNSNLGYQDNPFVGDVISVYNNNPEVVDGAERASFYELESASPMKALPRNGSMQHTQQIYVLEGQAEALLALCEKLFRTRKSDIISFLDHH